jgi:hypothetical protein
MRGGAERTQIPALADESLEDHALAGFIRHDAEQEVDRVVEAAGTEIVLWGGLVSGVSGRDRPLLNAAFKIIDVPL